MPSLRSTLLRWLGRGLHRRSHWCVVNRVSMLTSHLLLHWLLSVGGFFELLLLSKLLSVATMPKASPSAYTIEKPSLKLLYLAVKQGSWNSLLEIIQ